MGKKNPHKTKEDEYLAERIKRDNEISYFIQQSDNTTKELDNTSKQLDDEKIISKEKDK